MASPVCMASSLQFVKGVDEPCVPDIKLTRSKDGSSGTATFLFQEPAIFEEQEQLGDITGLYMVDDEGTIQTVEVSAKFVNGKPDRIEAFYIMKTAMQWDRFMRFMDRYAEDHGLGFNKARPSQSATVSSAACPILSDYKACSPSLTGALLLQKK